MDLRTIRKRMNERTKGQPKEWLKELINIVIALDTVASVEGSSFSDL